MRDNFITQLIKTHVQKSEMKSTWWLRTYGHHCAVGHTCDVLYKTTRRNAAWGTS